MAGLELYPDSLITAVQLASISVRFSSPCPLPLTSPLNFRTCCCSTRPLTSSSSLVFPLSRRMSEVLSDGTVVSRASD